MFGVRKVRSVLGGTVLFLVLGLVDVVESSASQFDSLADGLRRLLTKGQDQVVDPLLISSFDASDVFYGPVQVHCAETSVQNPNVLNTVVNWSSPGWAPEGTEAALSIRSMSKVFVSAVVLELVQRFDGLNLESQLSEFFPECATPRNLLRDATVEQLLNMESALDRRSVAFFSRDHVDWPEGLVGAPGTHPCELQNMTHTECVRDFICPMYAEEDVIQATKQFPHLFALQTNSEAEQTLNTTGEAPRFVKTSAPIVDKRCSEDNPAFRGSCPKWATQGFCHENPAFMLANCPRTCHVCSFIRSNASPCKDAKWCANAAQQFGHDRLMQYCAAAVVDCPETCRVCMQMRALPHLRSYFRVASEGSSSKIKTLFWEATGDAVYDNDGYLVLDAVVQAVTGRSVLSWLIELVAEPLQLKGILRCVKGEWNEDDAQAFQSRACYARARVEQPSLSMVAEDFSDRPKLLFQPQPGLETPLVSGVSIIASTTDVLKFLLALLDNHDEGVFSSETVTHMQKIRHALSVDLSAERVEKRKVELNTAFHPAAEHFPPSQTFQAFQFGLGYNLTGDFFSWGSTYGGRFFVFPRSKTSAACVVHSRMPLGGVDTPNDGGYYARFVSSR
eukprot:INCI7064.3.p1 GENE.INCI7064.3~~INCI7064.3.p1  ORF type:complete len:618 (+),score=85.04 INCI7064.3:299-2152(+)